MDEQTRHTVRDLVLDEDRFRRLTLNTGRQTTPDAWRRVVVRPVQLRGRRHLQFSYFDARQDVTKNYAGPAATRRLEELLHLPVR
ncbi:MAG TPA: SAM-dependent methyltransferase, partial [Chloroflexota bacterium]|nr:SAM-dependent methyltransferase [Chloroflexota bacterium]